MKCVSWLTFWLGALACVELAHSLVCFTCEQQVSNWNCLNMISCPEGSRKCLTIGSPSGTDDNADFLITKRCSQECPALSARSRRASVYCCGHTWCNLWGPK